MARDCECCKQWRKQLFWIDNEPPTVHFFFKVLMDGFHEKLFASNNSLEKHDLMVFRFNESLERDCCFKVMFFDKTACEKEGVACVRESDKPGLDTNGIQSVQINKDCTNNVLSSERSPCSSESSGKHSSERSWDSIDSCYYVTSGEESSEDSSDSSSVNRQTRENTFRVRHGYPSTLRVKKNPRQNLPVKKNRKSANNDNLQKSNKVHVSRNKDRVPRADTKSKGKSRLNPTLSGTSKKLSYYRYFQSQRRPVTFEEEYLTLKKAQALERNSTKPHFIKVMKRTHVYMRFFMTIPPKFIRKNFSEVPEMALLRVTGKAKAWKVTIITKGLDNLQPGISGGWADFVMENNLEKGDACLFELDNINPNYESVVTVDVTIFRVVDKIVPLNRMLVKPPL
ncbi:hypothetical protein AQUCO_01400282v1 [Aquilegia coerulea]|uniref:TF-B3 domain-containing protein n=1 Tax=Aquilegia coerulea TaxID=218851 RepID=A0A2G5DVK9_AQUCA|nr:hypothetical protein AQUCO_01400282v1 [Aquilegia coerulea]